MILLWYSSTLVLIHRGLEKNKRVRKWGPNWIFLRTVTLKFHNDSTLYKNSFRDSPHKNANSVIIYSPMSFQICKTYFFVEHQRYSEKYFSLFFGAVQWTSMGSSVWFSKVLQNIVCSTEVSHTGLERHEWWYNCNFWVNYTFKMTFKYLSKWFYIHIRGKTEVTYFVNLACARALERRKKTEKNINLTRALKKRQCRHST